MLKKYSRVMMAGFFVVLGIVMFISSFGMRSLAGAQIGPEFVPRIVAICLFALGLMDMAGEYKKVAAAAGQETAATEKNETAEVNEKKPFLKKYGFVLTIAILILYIYLMPSIGFVLTTISYLFLQICIFAHDLRFSKLVTYFVISCITSVSIYYIFVKVFQLILPSGILG